MENAQIHSNSMSLSHLKAVLEDGDSRKSREHLWGGLVLGVKGQKQRTQKRKGREKVERRRVDFTSSQRSSDEIGRAKRIVRKIDLSGDGWEGAKGRGA